jgi:hypothetical protein
MALDEFESEWRDHAPQKLVRVTRYWRKKKPMFFKSLLGISTLTTVSTCGCVTVASSESPSVRKLAICRSRTSARNR